MYRRTHDERTFPGYIVKTKGRGKKTYTVLEPVAGKTRKELLKFFGVPENGDPNGLLNKAIGKNLTCIFVDHGMLRKNEFRDVMEDYKCLGLNVIGVDASEKFFSDLAGVTDPEQKRKIIGRDFVEVFNAEAKKQTGAKWLAQGTIYPDRIESLNITGKVIKSHHNVGGLPKEMNLKLCEPLQWLFKDEVRKADFFHFTGYMWDTPNQKEAVRKAMKVAKANGVRISFDVADRWLNNTSWRPVIITRIKRLDDAGHCNAKLFVKRPSL